MRPPSGVNFTAFERILSTTWRIARSSATTGGSFGAKLYAFALASTIAGLGGILLAFKDRTLSFEGAFSPFGSINVVVLAVIGGIAYVLDEKGDFESRLNKEMVQLETLDADPGSLTKLTTQGGDVAVSLQSVMGDMREQDVERLHALISRHAHYTNSKTAQKILKDFAAYLPKFRKVMPTEYRRALADLAKAKLAAANAGGETAKP